MDNIGLGDGVASVLLPDEIISALCFLGGGLLATKLAVESRSIVGKLVFLATGIMDPIGLSVNRPPATFS